eukprot:TRINITY_DN290_c1_g3_i4.p2 TRINITY_DN290_c1_g3~~TRINITY_DN290_c1_g3_i4.p2  ORF type:complete len:1276 (+),score=518.94 TRINITY_DN290_c1_g3_i4:24104-27931(+)
MVGLLVDCDGGQYDQPAAGVLSWRTSATVPPVICSSCVAVRLNSACGWPAAAQTLSKLNRSRSISITGLTTWPTGQTPPMAQPVFSRTNLASALPSGPTRAVTLDSSTRLPPLAITSTGASSARRRKMMDLAISATPQPTAAAASAEVRPVEGSITTGWSWPMLESRSATRWAEEGRGWAVSFIVGQAGQWLKREMITACLSCFRRQDDTGLGSAIEQEDAIAARRAGLLQLRHAPACQGILFHLHEAFIGDAQQGDLAHHRRQLHQRDAAPVQQQELHQYLDAIVGIAQRIGLQVIQSRKSLRQRIVDLMEGRAMAGDDGAHLQRADQLQRGTGFLETGFAIKLGEDDAEAIAPQRIGRDQHAFLRAVEQQRMRIMAGRGQQLPVQVAQAHDVAAAQRLRMGKARAALAGGAIAQRGFIPAAHLLCFGGGDGDAAVVLGLQRGIATAMVGMQVGVDQQVQARAAALRQHVAYQRLRLLGMGDIAAVDHRHLVAAEQQHVVGRQPAPFQYMDGRGDPERGGVHRAGSGGLEFQQLRALGDLVADRVEQVLDGAGGGGGDGVFHLHRLHDQQRRTLRHGGPLLYQQRDDLAGHGRGQAATLGFAVAGMGHGIEIAQAALTLLAEHMQPLALAHHIGLQVTAIEIDLQAIVVRGIDLQGMGLAIDVQCPVPAIAGIVDLQRGRAGLVLQRERAQQAGVESPAVGAGPGIGRAGGRGGLPFFLQQGRRCQRQRLDGGGGCRREERIAMAFDQAGIEVGAGKGAAGHQPLQEADVGGQADHLVLRQRTRHVAQSGIAVGAPDDELGDHRIIEGRDGIALAHARIDAHLRRLACVILAQLELHRRRTAHARQRADGGQEALLRILRIDARLDGVAVEAQGILLQRQGLAGGDAQLPLHQVQAGDHLGDRMLDLQARIHFHEIETAILAVTLAVTVVGDEFHRARTLIADRARGGHRRFAHGGAALGAQAGGGGFFQHFLVTTLHRAIAFEQVDVMAVGIGEDLDLDMARAGQVFFHQHAVVTKAGDGLALAGGQGRHEIFRALDHAHALATAAGTGLEQYRIADAVGFAAQEVALLAFTVIARYQWHGRRFHQRLGGRLGAHGANGRGRRADEDQAGIGAGLGELGVLRQETIAGMDGLRAGSEGGGDDLVTAQVTFLGRGRAQMHAFIAGRDMLGARIGIGIHGHRGNAQATCGGRHAAGDFAAIGDQDLAEHGVSSVAWFRCGTRRTWSLRWGRSGPPTVPAPAPGGYRRGRSRRHPTGAPRRSRDGPGLRTGRGWAP